MVVLVWRYHPSIEAQFLRFLRHRADDVVRLETRHPDDGNSHGFKETLDKRKLLREIFRRSIASGFVFAVLFVPERGFGRIHSRRNMRRLLLENVEKRVRNAKYGVGTCPERRVAGAANQRIVRAIRQRHRIQQKQFLIRIKQHGSSFSIADCCIFREE